MKKRSKKKIYVFIGVLFSILGFVTVFFNVPYSKVKAEFTGITGGLLTKTAGESGEFSEEDIADLPLPVQKYFRYCGYIGSSKMSSIKVEYRDVDFLFGKDKSTMKIDYTQYNYVEKPIRIAYIDSSMYGIPFEGLDTYIEGNASMKGVIAKLFTLFNQSGEVMDKASLVTCLSECLLIPNVALQDYVIWQEIDNVHAKATISYYDISASGIFTFNEQGEMLSFTTYDRAAVSADGRSENVKWSAVFGEYEETDSIKKPTAFQAIWHYDDGDLVYFDGKGTIND